MCWAAPLRDRKGGHGRSGPSVLAFLIAVATESSPVATFHSVPSADLQGGACFVLQTNAPRHHQSDAPQALGVWPGPQQTAVL